MDIFTICLFWCLSIVFAFLMQCSLTLNIIKTLAINSYTFDNERLSEVANLSNENFKFLNFVPLINIVFSLYIYFQYANNTEKIFTQMNYLKILLKFTEEEVTRYKEKPTTITALEIMLERNENN